MTVRLGLLAVLAVVAAVVLDRAQIKRVESPERRLRHLDEPAVEDEPTPSPLPATPTPDPTAVPLVT